VIDPDSPALPVVIEHTDGAVRGLILNRPEKRNALDSALVTTLAEALRRAEADPAIRVVTLQGAGKDFSAGADLASLERLGSASMVENLRDAEALADLFLLIRNLGKPVVALVRGRALAGGFGIATACDLVFASDSATFGYTEIRLGFVPAIVMAILHRDLPGKRAFELLTSGTLYPAAEMERFGVVNRVFRDEELEARAGEFVQTLASRSASAVSLTKRLLRGQDTLTPEGAIRAGVAVNTLARLTDDTRAGVAEFLRARDRKEG